MYITDVLLCLFQLLLLMFYCVCCSLLGDTIEKIAWQKSGIMKKNKPIFIDGDQPQVSTFCFKRNVYSICQVKAHLRYLK